MFESQALSTVPSAVRTRPLRERLGQLVTTDFVGLHVGKTAFGNESSAIEGDIKEADTIDLDVIVSQAHQ